MRRELRVHLQESAMLAMIRGCKIKRFRFAPKTVSVPAALRLNPSYIQG